MYLAPRPDKLRLNAITQSLANRMIAAYNRRYGYGADPAGSPGIGTTADFFALTYLVPAWTLELEPANGGEDYGGLATHGHSGFILPAAEAPAAEAVCAVAAPPPSRPPPPPTPRRGGGGEGSGLALRLLGLLPLVRRRRR